jgi:hypothetical protein
MRRRRAFKRGRVLSIVVAGFAGYVLGGWNGSAPRSPELSAAQAVALRFPQDLDDASAVTAAAATMSNMRLALLSPQPMIAQASAAPVQQASAPALAPAQTVPPMAAVAALPQAAPAMARTGTVKPVAIAHRRDDRPGYILNDAQIASIKTRLHLTADQEQMWPAVEAALRNISYTRTRDAHRRGAPTNTAQLAVAEPDAADVQGLKSAAIPLIMSFNAEQKDEVRSLAHVMGLDQLAAQF